MSHRASADSPDAADGVEKFLPYNCRSRPQYRSIARSRRFSVDRRTHNVLAALVLGSKQDPAEVPQPNSQVLAFSSTKRGHLLARMADFPRCACPGGSKGTSTRHPTGGIYRARLSSRSRWKT